MTDNTYDENGHHLILGETTDYITGNTIPDTHDERYRQKISHLLVDSLGFNKNDVEKSKKHLIVTNKKKAELKLDFLINLNGKACMMIRYAPGSLVSRRQCAIGWSRIVMPYQIPVIVITNGKDAEIIEGTTGKVVDKGLKSIPSRQILEKKHNTFEFTKISDKKRIMAARIVYAFEVDGSCNCDTDICRLD